MNRLLRICCIFLIMVLPLCSADIAYSAVQWSFAVGGNGHYYEYVAEWRTWDDAKLAAEQRVYMGMSGHLATITSQMESEWIIANIQLPINVLLGGYQDQSAPDYSKPNGGWRWVTGEDWLYTNWTSGEPNNTLSAEQVLEIMYPPQWNDVPGEQLRTFLVEYEPVPEPICTIAPTPTDTASYLYDDFNDNHTNTELWTIDTSGIGPWVVETNKRMEVTLPSNSSGASFWGCYLSKFKLHGDFDMQVDYKLLEWPEANCTRVGLGISGFGAIIRSYGTSPTNPSISTDIYQVDFSGVPGMPIDRVVTNDKSGKLRLVRSGDKITGYYYIDSNWHSLYTVPAPTDDRTLVLSVWNHDACFSHQQVKIAFDNFIINSGQIVPAIPEPPSPPVDKSEPLDSAWDIRGDSNF